MGINSEKNRRMELRRAIGNRLPPQPRPKLAPPESYLLAHACFGCRKSFKLHARDGAIRKCPDCAGELHVMGRSFKAPPKKDVEQWRKVQALYAYGFRFYSYRSFPGAPRLPLRFRDVDQFVAQNPNHPFRVGAPNKALKPAISTAARRQHRHARHSSSRQ